MTHMLMPLAGGKLVVCLEVCNILPKRSLGFTHLVKGGYNLKSISKSALAVTRTLMGESPDRMQSTRPTPSGAATVQKVMAYHSKYWPFLHPNGEEEG